MSIKITSNAKEVIKALKKFEKDKNLNINKALHQVGKTSVRYAQSIAPKGRTGELSRGITHNVFSKKKMLEIRSMVNKRFPYNFWVNLDIPTIQGRPPYFASGQRIKYGGPAKTPSGKQARWTGMPGFFNVTAKLMMKSAPNRS